MYWLIIFLTTLKNRKPLLEGNPNKEKGALKVERKKANDGRPAYPRNFIIYWEDNENVIVTIDGYESAETIKINVLKK